MEGCQAAHWSTLWQESGWNWTGVRLKPTSASGSANRQKAEPSSPQTMSSPVSAAVEGSTTADQGSPGASPRRLQSLQPISSAAAWHKYVQTPRTYCRLQLHLQPQGEASNYFLKAFLSVFNSKSRWWDFWGHVGKDSLYSSSQGWGQLCKWILLCFCCSIRNNAQGYHPEDVLSSW